MRADFARIQNEVLAKYGYSIRVDHRTLEVQQAVAEQNDDAFLAKLYKRVTESYIGIVSAHEGDRLSEEVKKYRERNQEKQHSLFLDDLKQKSTAEGENQFIRDYESKVSQRGNLERFLTELVPTSTYLYPENQKVFKSLRAKWRKKFLICVLSSSNIDVLRTKLEVKEKPKTMFIASEIREDLFKQYRSLKKQYEKAVDNRNSLMFSQVSPINALNRAKNIFVHDDFDKLHAQQEEYEEASTQFANNIILPNKKSSWK